MIGSSGFPSLPGYNPSHDPTLVDHKRKSAKKQEQLRDYANRPVPKYPVPRRAEPEKPDQTRMLNPAWQSTTHSVHAPMNSEEITEQFEPAFVRLDRHVLRFNGYFKESVVESRLENFRVRKLILYYYLEDHTLSIIEPKIQNSGTPQGAFLKRRAVLKEDGSGMAIEPSDLRVGENIVIFGKNIRLVDCDAYSREFYEINNMPQGPAEEVPADPFDRKVKEPVVSQKDAMMKDFLEKSLGGGRPKSEKQFLDNDRRVLRFYCKSGEDYVLHYYLADDTVEILECHYPNDGKMDFNVLLRRNKLPKAFNLGQPGHAVVDNYLKDHEIMPDMTVSAFGRQFTINSADIFTVNYYRENYNRAFPLGPLQEAPPREVSNVVIPPHDGLGSEEDSLGYVYRLIPKPPNKDYFKFIDNSHKILRWVVKLNTTSAEDIDRRFIISYFLNDDTLQIQEIPQRNSGIVEGKFLARNRYKNSENNSSFFKPTDFLLNKDVMVNSYRFHIESCDEYTRKYMEQTYNIC